MFLLFSLFFFPGLPSTVDMLFIDTSHLYSETVRELNAWGPLMSGLGVGVGVVVGMAVAVAVAVAVGVGVCAYVCANSMHGAL